jgi:WD40 repeat protein
MKFGISNGVMTGRTWQVRVKINPQSYGVEELVLFFWEHGRLKLIIMFILKSPLDSGLSSPQDWAAHHILHDHAYPVTCLAWSLDDTILLTSADHFIKLWNTKVNTLYRRLSDKTLTPDPKDWRLYSHT